MYLLHINEMDNCCFAQNHITKQTHILINLGVTHRSCLHYNELKKNCKHWHITEGCRL